MRIGINIPKELHQRLQPLKGTLNISQVCREALEAHVERYEEFIGWLSSDEAKKVVAEICELELQRKAMVEVDWETVGYQDAKDWVQAATLADWDYWERCRNHPHRPGQNTIWVHGRHVRDGTKGRFVSPGQAKTFLARHRECIDRIHQQDAAFWEWMDEEYDGLGPVYDYGAAERGYGRGWMTYTTAVWEMICQERDELRQRQHREHAESLRTRPDPQMPNHILEAVRRAR